MTVAHDVPGTAALAICESLLFALEDYKVLPESEIVGNVEDAAGAYSTVHRGDGDPRRAAVAALIEDILPDDRPIGRR